VFRLSVPNVPDHLLDELLRFVVALVVEEIRIVEQLQG
jgi:hypothetical protein